MAKQVELVHRVCDHMKTTADLSSCNQCPATTDTPYGTGNYYCRLMAQRLIDMVRAEPVGETPPRKG